MFKIDNKTIKITRGDIAKLEVTANIGANDEEKYLFKVGDTVRLHVMEKKNTSNIVLNKTINVIEPSEKIEISLTGEDTTIGDVINKPTTYWYEIELNHDKNPQTIIGYDDDGAKEFILYPEGVDIS